MFSNSSHAEKNVKVTTQGCCFIIEKRINATCAIVSASLFRIATLLVGQGESPYILTRFSFRIS